MGTNATKALHQPPLARRLVRADTENGGRNNVAISEEG
jgi:hypothetical protein